MAILIMIFMFNNDHDNFTAADEYVKIIQHPPSPSLPLPQPTDVHARCVEVRPRHLRRPCSLPLHSHGHCCPGLNFEKHKTEIEIQAQTTFLQYL